MLLKTKSGRRVELPGAEEAGAIDAGIAADPDTYEWNDAEFSRARPARDVLPEIFSAEVAGAMLKPSRRPEADAPNAHLNARLDSDVAEGFKATGKDWQTRMNAVLREWLDTHRKARRVE